jgi:hypothetical protein
MGGGTEMIRERLIQHIAASQSPVNTAAVAASIGLTASAETLAAIDMMLALSPEVNALPEGWMASVDTRERRILDALREYAAAHPEKRIFRGAAALGRLKPEDQMTEPELRKLLSRTDEFKLLANAMIKRGS